MVMTTERVWEEFHPKLKQFVLRRMPDEQSGEDILQDVFLKIHTRIDTLRNEEKLQSWIYQIARHLIIDRYRRRRAVVGLLWVGAISSGFAFNLVLMLNLV